MADWGLLERMYSHFAKKRNNAFFFSFPREVSNIATGFLWIKYIYYVVCVSCMITILKTDNPNTSENGKMLGEIKYCVCVSYFLFPFLSTREQVSSSLQHNPPEVSS